MFMARAVSAGQAGKWRLRDDPIPELCPESRARTFYNECFGPALYADLSNLQSGVMVLPTSETDAPANLHRAAHDVESCFFVIVVFLLLALPEGFGPEDDNTDSVAGIWALFNHHKPGSTDSRFSNLIGGDWRHWLHPGLVSLRVFLAKLSEQVYPEYLYMVPPPEEEHLHESLQRLLLQQICEMEAAGEPIPLNIDRCRNPPDPSHAGHSNLGHIPESTRTKSLKASVQKSNTSNASSGSKRKLDAHDQPEGSNSLGAKRELVSLVSTLECLFWLT